jgi:hypothetical protein
VALKIATAALAVVLIAGCGGVKSSRRLKPEVMGAAEAWTGVRRVAVLPADNWTFDLGLEYVTWYRAVIHELLREKGYDVVPLADVNRFFNRNKFTVAGEAGIYSPGSLCEAFRSDAVLYWAITDGAPRLMFSLEKADGTPLWSTGEIALGLSFVAPVSGRFVGNDRGVALALGEILRHLPRSKS